MATISPTTLNNGTEPYTGKKAYIRLTITEISQTDGATNQTTVKWKLTVEGTPWTVLYRAYCTLGGKVLYDAKPELSNWSAGQQFASGTTTFNNNSDGSLTLTAYVKQQFYYGNGDTSRWTNSYYYQEASTNMVCSKIPRYATSNQSLNSKTETSITMNWSSDSTVDYLWYSVDNGAYWIGVDVADGTSGTYSIGGLSANTTYNIKTRVRRKDSQLTTDSSNLSVTTYAYPYCTKAPDFTIGNQLTVEFYNPLNRTIQIQMWSHRSQAFVSDLITTNGTSYKGFVDVVDRLYASIPNNTDSVYNIDVYYGGNKAIKEGGKYSIKGTETPNFSTFTYKDSNTAVTNITGNNQVLVKGLSTLQVTIPSANKMVAKNSAIAKNYVMSIDTLSKTVAYSTSDITASVGTVTSSGTKRLNVRAYDSRNLSTLVYKDITVYDYAKPVINASITRLNNFENQTTIKVNGTYTRLTIGGTDKNTITNVQYRYRESGGTWSSWTTLSTTVSSGKFTCSDVILSLDNTKSFEFQIQAVDKLQTNTSTKNLDIGQAIFFISSNKKACYINGQQIIMYDVVDEW